MPATPQVPQIDRERPECVALENRIKQRQRSLAQWRRRLEQPHSLEEREEILRNIRVLSEEIRDLEEEFGFLGCYIPPPPQQIGLLKIVGVEATQSTQFFHLEGTGAGRDNSIRFISGKPTLVRAYVRSDFPDFVAVTARLSVYEFNPNTLKYDIFRKQFPAMSILNRPGLSTSRRLNINDTLTFLIPASDCYGRVRLDIKAWVLDHEGDSTYEGDGVQTVDFITTRQPTIECFRVEFSRTNPAPAPPTVLPAPTFADCQQTMALAQRMFPLASLNVVDRGTLNLSGPLTTQADYDAVRVRGPEHSRCYDVDPPWLDHAERASGSRYLCWFLVGPRCPGMGECGCR